MSEQASSSPATKADIQALQAAIQGCVTKEDIRAFATKDDLRAFATKDDLRAFATKDDLRAFATKDDLRAFPTKEDLQAVRSELKEEIKQVNHRLAVDQLRLDKKITDVKEELSAQMSTGFSKIMNSIDSFAAKSENYDRATTLHGRSLVEVEVKISDHEKRISDLESKS